MRLLTLALSLLILIAVSLAAHLGERDRRKGSHRQKTHGTRAGFGVDGPSARRAAHNRMVDGYKKREKKPSVMDAFDDPFADDDDGDEPKSKEDRAREKYEAKMVRDLERAERSRVYSIIQELGGLKTRDDLREEYAGIPNTFKRRDGLAGDDLADHFANYYPEFGIEDERDLIDFLAA